MRPIEIRGLDHVVLRISDLSRSLRFYVELLGCREERRSDALGLVQLRAGANLIDLVVVNSPLGKLGGPPAGAQARNVDHIALQLEHFDADQIRARLAEFGVEAGRRRAALRRARNGPLDVRARSRRQRGRAQGAAGARALVSFARLRLAASRACLQPSSRLA